MNHVRSFVNVRLGGLRLRAGLWPTVATLLLVPVLVELGVWQLHRAAEKQALQAEYDRRQEQPAVRLEAALESPDTLRFRRVVARGRYQPDYQILLDNRVHEGRAGYYVLTPLRVVGGALHVLVNRGWVPLGRDRAALPRIDTPDGEVEVSGIATVPQTQGFHLGPARPPGPGWQRVWEYLDLEAYARSVPFPVHAVVVLLDPDSPAGGLTRQWARLDTGIAMHRAYAFQWLSLAVALVAIYILVNTRRNQDAPDRTDD